MDGSPGGVKYRAPYGANNDKYDFDNDDDDLAYPRNSMRSLPTDAAMQSCSASTSRLNDAMF